jgi:hypothetical protein
MIKHSSLKGYLIKRCALLFFFAWVCVIVHEQLSLPCTHENILFQLNQFVRIRSSVNRFDAHRTLKEVHMGRLLHHSISLSFDEKTLKVSNVI